MKSLLFAAATAFALSGAIDTYAAPFSGHGSNGRSHAAPSTPSRGSSHGVPSYEGSRRGSSHRSSHGSSSYDRGHGASSHGSHAAPSRGHHHGPVTKVRTVEMGRRTIVRTVRSFRGHPRTVYVTEITYRDYYSNGTSRIWTRTI